MTKTSIVVFYFCLSPDSFTRFMLCDSKPSICIFYLISCTYLWTRFLPSKSEQTPSGVFSDNAWSASRARSVTCDTMWHVTVCSTSHESGGEGAQWDITTPWTLWSNKLNPLSWIRLQMEFWSVVCSVAPVVFIDTLQVAGPSLPWLILSVMSRVW